MIGTVTAKQWKEIILFYGRACALCHVPESESPLTIDHFVPVSKGGVHNWWNVWPLCLPCNSKKKNKMPKEIILYFLCNSIPIKIMARMAISETKVAGSKIDFDIGKS